MKILLISHTFLPSTIANAKRPYYMAKTFLETGHTVDVISSFRGMSIDQPEELIHSCFHIKRVDDPQEALCRKIGGHLGHAVYRGFRAVFWPDEFVLWSVCILFRVKIRKYDRVIVFLRPESLMLFSLLKGVSDKWVFDCQEAFVPERVKLRRSPIHRIFFPIFMRLQSKVLKQAGKVSFTSERSRLEYIKYGLVSEESSRILPLFFDDTLHVKERPAEGSEKFIIEYTGQFNRLWGRTPEPFLRSLHLFLSRNPGARASVVFSFHGPWVEDHTALVHELELTDIVHIHPPVPYGTYLKVLSEATVLFLFAAKEDNLFIPGKMLDYFSTNKPILSFVPFDSETYLILKEAKMDEFCSDANDVELGSRNIERLWKKWSMGESLRIKSNAEKWSWSHQKNNILKLIDYKNYNISL